MYRLIAFLLTLSPLLAACQPAAPPSATDTPAQMASHSATTTPTVMTVPSTPSTATPEGGAAPADEGAARVWYLGSNGWAVQIGEKLLVFDYQEHSDPNPPASSQERKLDRGYIHMDELQAFDAYVFVTHSHGDHFDPLILEWQRRVDEITYFFGWKVGDNPEHHYLVGPRAQAQAGDVEVYTINSHHSGVPEVAFLVKVGGYTIYHNGDYRAEYVEDYAYLATITDHIDIAFVIGHPFVDHPYFQQAVRLSEVFRPTYLFAMNREGDEHKCREFGELLAEHVMGVNVVSAERRGDVFLCPRSQAE